MVRLKLDSTMILFHNSESSQCKTYCRHVQFTYPVRFVFESALWNVQICGLLGRVNRWDLYDSSSYQLQAAAAQRDTHKETHTKRHNPLHDRNMTMRILAAFENCVLQPMHLWLPGGLNNHQHNIIMIMLILAAFENASTGNWTRDMKMQRALI